MTLMFQEEVIFNFRNHSFAFVDLKDRDTEGVYLDSSGNEILESSFEWANSNFPRGDCCDCMAAGKRPVNMLDLICSLPYSTMACFCVVD